MSAEHRLPTVAIVGRPNVGKSTLLNRIIGRREAIVEAQPGVTRDRKEVEAEWNGRSFVVIDTGGWIRGGDQLDAKVSAQSERALLDADVALFVVDASVGLTEDDAKVAELLRRRDGASLVVANKVDDAVHEGLIWDFLAFGLGEPVAVSALHGRNAGGLLDQVVALLPTPAEAAGEVRSSVEDPPSIREASGDREGTRLFAVAIVGRPNVGKSTLFNRLIGDDRAVVHDLPGTTRDTVDTVVASPDGPIRFVDTAGMRRRSRVDPGTERFSIIRALAAIDAADIALLVIDATEGVTHQDQRLAERIDGAGCPVVVVLNKWELLDAEARESVDYQVGRRLAFLGECLVLKMSALTGKGCIACFRRCPKSSWRTAAASRPGGSTRSWPRHRRPSLRPVAPGCSMPPRWRRILRRSRCSPTVNSHGPICAIWRRRCAGTWASGPPR